MKRKHSRPFQFRTINQIIAILFVTINLIACKKSNSSSDQTNNVGTRLKKMTLQVTQGNPNQQGYIVPDLIEYFYDGNGKLIKIKMQINGNAGDSISDVFERDNNGLIKKRTHKETTQSPASSTTEITNFQTSTDGHYLTAISSQSPNIEYHYVYTGNRITSVQTYYNATLSSTKNISYDSRGNVLTGYRWSYTYDNGINPLSLGMDAIIIDDDRYAGGNNAVAVSSSGIIITTVAYTYNINQMPSNGVINEYDERTGAFLYRQSCQFIYE